MEKDVKTLTFVSDSKWHLIIGGKSAANYISAAELYNWETGAQCRVKDLPLAFGKHSGTVIDGVPIVCGGTTDAATIQTKCYKFDTKLKDWLNVSSIVNKLLCRSRLKQNGHSTLLPSCVFHHSIFAIHLK